MSKTANGIINKVYTLNNSEELLLEVTKALCILTPDCLITAGYNDKGKILLIDYCENIPNANSWDTDFFESRFTNRSLVPVLNKVVAVFLSGTKTMLIPRPLFSEEIAAKWMHDLFFIEKGETIYMHPLKDGKTNYMFTSSSDLITLVDTHLPKVRKLPLAAYQFLKKHKGDIMECCICNNEVFTTFYKNGMLQWHQGFQYQTIEDIAYKIRRICRVNDIYNNEFTLHCIATGKDLSGTITGLSQYFPEMENTEPGIEPADNSWSSTIQLLQQLYTCV